MAAEPIRILLVEDNEADGQLIVRELHKAGIPHTSQRVQNEAGLRRALHEFAPDIVLSDHSLPHFTAQYALRLILRERPGTPVIIVTGSLDEETAAEYIKAGAADYVVKHHLTRLGSAVRRALALRDALAEATAAEAARSRSELRFRKLVEYSSDVITLLDPVGRILYSTQALKPTLGYEMGEMTGQSVFTLVHPDDHGRAKELLREVLAGGAPVVRADLRVRHKDGSWRDLQVAVANHLDDAVVEAIVINYHDVTERNRAQAALRELEEQRRQGEKMAAIGRLASGVAHDFNNVLTVITACCEFLHDSIPEGVPGHTDVLEIRQAADQAASLTKQLLAFSRKEVASVRLVDLNAVVGNMAGMLRRLLGAQVCLAFTPRQDLGSIWADPGQVEQVVMNLAVNARDAMPGGGRLTIQTQNAEVDLVTASVQAVDPGPYVMLTVSDTGTGMDAATKARLFEPFFTTKPQGKGTGLGLATVYGIVQTGRGFILVDTQLGGGTTFRVYWPQSTTGARR